ncbi:Hypothetical Protein NTJ_02594 [Nesidiocoris tenuis]|uniref:CCHC-type domain-containing protein n=1 Tax=Nesidiocoris tenuis TaxID=355587 RepID=A0ABN7ABU3_9HEMI|nr:Hypothetical Protein NTJ_02594 [Nesidiocoris tenuis]
MKFVAGLKSGPILDRLCEEDDNVQLQALYKIALKKEASIREQQGAVSEVHRLGARRRPPTASSSSQSNLPKEERRPKSGHSARTPGQCEVPPSSKASGKICYACNKGSHDFKT